jgi:hypothetical protein
MVIIKARMLFFLILIGAGARLGANSWAGEKAQVTRHNAVVFADPELRAPIGKLKKGQEIFISNSLRKRGAVAVLGLSGRTAYMKVKDIQLIDKAEDEGLNDVLNNKTAENGVHQQEGNGGYPDQGRKSERFGGKPYEARVKANYSVVKAYATDVATLDNDTSGSELSLDLELWPKRDWGGSFGIQHGSLSSPATLAELSYWAFRVGGNYIPWRYENMAWLVNGQLIYSPFTTLVRENIRYKGNMLGLDLSSQLEFEFTNTWGLNFGAGLEHLQVANLANGDSGRAMIVPAFQITAFRAFLGIHWNI